MKKKLENRKFFIRDYLSAKDMMDDAVAYAEECKDRYPRCIITTTRTRDDFGVGIEVIAEQQIKEDEKDISSEGKGEER